MLYNRILLCYSKSKDPEKEFTNYFLGLLNKYFKEKEIIVETVEEIKEYYEPFDYAFSIGGDGTFLRVAHAVCNTPIVGINLGRKGFLATIEKENAEEAVKSIVNYRYSIKRRSFICGCIDDNQLMAVNDITIGKKDFMKTVHIELYVDDKFVNSYICDGMVISTAFGSTAYNRALNNIIAHPDAPIHIITPIASNDKLFKSLIVYYNSKITVKVLENNTSSDVVVGFDGTQHIVDLKNQINIYRAPEEFLTLELFSYDYYENLKKKI